MIEFITFLIRKGAVEEGRESLLCPADVTHAEQAADHHPSSRLVPGIRVLLEERADFGDEDIAFKESLPSRERYFLHGLHIRLNYFLLAKVWLTCAELLRK